VRQEGAQLQSVDGEVTSHLSGFFYRTIRLVENGLKPVFVFDGKPPEMKSGTLEKRAEKRADAQKALDEAMETGTVEDIDKNTRKLVKVTKAHNEEVRKLLGLMGIPCITASCEAEAQCAALQKAGKVYAVATEDMDALTFGTNVLLRHTTFSESRKMPIKEFHLDRVLQAMEYTMDQFIDLCILLGCDYCDSIKGIGPKRAIELITKYQTIESVVKNLDQKKYPLPENWPFEEARRLFTHPDVTDPESLKITWNPPDEEGLVAFMSVEKGFMEDRIRNGCKKLQKARQTSTQGRLDTFFKVLPSTPAAKRPSEEKKGNEKKKAKTGGGGFRRGK